MSAKNVDKHNCFRSITVGFRVSPEEQEELNRVVALSGLPKQEYCYRKCMGREVVVQPNPRVHKALKTQMAAILAELERRYGRECIGRTAVYHRPDRCHHAGTERRK